MYNDEFRSFSFEDKKISTCLQLWLFILKNRTEFYSRGPSNDQFHTSMTGSMIQFLTKKFEIYPMAYTRLHLPADTEPSNLQPNKNDTSKIA